jgi:hypothetical protein
MSLPRIVDVIAVAAVAVVVLLPSGSLVAKPALVGDKVELDRIAALEDQRFSAPDDVERALALGYAYLRAQHPEWTLETTAAFTGAGDHRVHTLRATAWAERLQAADAVAEAQKGYEACDREGPQKCDPSARVRLGVVAAPMQALVDAGIDPRQDPRRARDTVAGVLHATKTKDLLQTAPKPPATKPALSKPPASKPTADVK